MLQLHQGKAILIMLGKAREINITHASLKVNVTIMKEEENEIYPLKISYVIQSQNTKMLIKQ